LLEPLVKDPHAAAIPADPHVVADELGGHFVKRAFDFHVAVAMDVTLGFLVAGKQRGRQGLQVRAFLFKTGGHLLTGRAMDALVGHAAFPMGKEAV
jgi:hypothetical protein